jgi:hypothetical protein
LPAAAGVRVHLYEIDGDAARVRRMHASRKLVADGWSRWALVRSENEQAHMLMKIVQRLRHDRAGLRRRDRAVVVNLMGGSATAVCQGDDGP